MSHYKTHLIHVNSNQDSSGTLYKQADRQAGRWAGRQVGKQASTCILGR